LKNYFDFFLENVGHITGKQNIREVWLFDTGMPAFHVLQAAMAGLSPEEIKKRQEYLRQQRDKLVAMKKQEREKQLLSAEQSNPGRPASARAARQMLQGEKVEEKPKLSEEEQKKIEMRKQIANKLKAELMGGGNWCNYLDR